MSSSPGPNAGFGESAAATPERAKAGGSQAGQTKWQVVLKGPLAVWTLASEAILQSNCFAYAELTAWRYITDDSSTSADFQQLGQKTGTITTGPILDRLNRALAVADSHFSPNGQGDYLISILEVPTLQLAALNIESEGNRYFITYKDPRPDVRIKIDSVTEFVGRMSTLLHKLARTDVDTTLLDSTTNASFQNPLFLRETSPAATMKQSYRRSLI